MRRIAFLTATLVSLGASHAGAQARTDTSSHRTRLVTVADSVQLEVLEWGGTGRPLVLLAGLGSTAHTFDEFAPKLAASYRVYGVTRRGFGRSSMPAFGYDADQLGDDVLAVIDSLGLRRPLLAGHSMAGQELSSIGSRHPDKVAGLIYLDAGYDYALYDTSHGNVSIDINEMIRQLDRLRLGSGASPQERHQARLVLADSSLPALLAHLRAMLQEPVPTGAPRSRPMARIPYAIISGQRKYTKVHGPVLAIFASPRSAPPGAEQDSTMRAMIAEADSATELQIRAFARGVPQARVVRLPRADHFVFRSHEADVLREMGDFVGTLPREPQRQ